MLKDFFEDLDTLINTPIAEQPTMPARPASEVVSVRDTNTPRNLFDGNKTASARAGKYSIDKKHRKLIIGGHEYYINDFFNIENAVSGDFKTLDYIFTFNNLNIDDFRT